MTHFKDPLYANSYWLIIGTAITSVSGFLFWAIVTRYYAISDVGIATAIFSLIGIFTLFAELGLNFGIVRCLPEEVDKQNMINSCITVTSLVSAVLAVVFLAGITVWSPALTMLRNDPVLALLLIAFSAISPARSILSNVFIANRKAVYSLYQNIIWVVLLIPLPLILHSHGVKGIFVSWGLAISISVLAATSFLATRLGYRYQFRPRIDLNALLRMIGFSAGNYVSMILLSIPGLMLPLMIVNLLSPAMAAYFYVGWLIVGLLFAIPGAITTSLFAEGSNKPDELDVAVKKALRFAFTLLVPAVIGVCVLGDWILKLFGSAYSENAAEMLLILAISGIPFTYNQVYIAVKRVQKMVKPIIWISAFVCMFTLIGSYLLIPHLGLLGIGVSWTTAQIISVLAVVSLGGVCPQGPSRKWQLTSNED